MIEPPRLVTTTAQLVAFIPIRISREKIREVMGPGIVELKAAVAEQRVAVAGPWFTHHVTNPGQIFDFEICLPVATPVTPAGRTQAGEWPSMKVAQTTYHGGFEGLGAGWGEFMAALESAGHKVADGLWEQYLVGPETEASPAAWRTQLSKRVVDA